MNGILRGEMTDFYVASQSLSLSEMINFTTWDCRQNMNVFDRYTSKKLIDWKNHQVKQKKQFFIKPKRNNHLEEKSKAISKRYERKIENLMKNILKSWSWNKDSRVNRNKIES